MQMRFWLCLFIFAYLLLLADDRVILVDYLEYVCKPLKTQKQRTMYEPWASQAFTKWQCLLLTEYEKVHLSQHESEVSFD